MGRRKDRRRSSISDPSVDPPVTNKDTRMSVKTEKREDKSEAKSDKYDFKVSKIESKTQKSLATAEKRNALANLIKWVVIAIGVIYGMTKLGGLDLGGDLLEKAKGLIGG